MWGYAAAMTESSDWRLQGQDAYLRGVELQWKRYRAHSETWEHDHCSFCWTKFADPEFSTAHRELAGREDTLVEGYTTTSEHEQGADYHWVCARCFSDFADAFEWRVVS